MVVILHVTECYAGGVSRAINMIVGADPTNQHHLLWCGDEEPLASCGFATVTKLPVGWHRRVKAVNRLVHALKADVVHAHSSWAGLYARLRRLPCQVIYQPHGFAFEKGAASQMKRAIFFAAEKILARRSCVIVGVSKRELSLARTLTRAGRTMLIPNTSLLEPPEARKRITASGPVVAMSGRLCAQKDPSDFANVALAVKKLLPNAQFVWIGDGDDSYRAMLERAQVRITGWLEADALAVELQRVTMYYHSAAYEGFPISVLDAGTMSIPMVLRDIAAFEDLRDLTKPSFETIVKQIYEVCTLSECRQSAIAATQSMMLLMGPNDHAARVQALYAGLTQPLPLTTLPAIPRIKVPSTSADPR